MYLGRATGDPPPGTAVITMVFLCINHGFDTAVITMAFLRPETVVSYHSYFCVKAMVFLQFFLVDPCCMEL